MILTIGHSNHPLDAFLGLLRRHEVEVLVDVRSYPVSRHVPHFSRDRLVPAIESAGMRYLYLGRELGGRPTDPHLLTRQGTADYDRIRRTPPFQAALDRLVRGARRHRAAIMCAEEDPTGCHRSRLVARALMARGVEVHHVRGDGERQAHATLTLGSPRQLRLL